MFINAAQSALRFSTNRLTPKKAMGLKKIGQIYLMDFKKSFGIYPNKYVSRGFDLTLDVVLRLVNFGNFSSKLTSAETSFTENRFKYVKSKSGGYVNQSGFILKHQNLFIVKMTEF